MAKAPNHSVSIDITKNQFDINFEFYFFLKYVVRLAPSHKRITLLLESIFLFPDSPGKVAQQMEEEFPASDAETVEEIIAHLKTSVSLELLAFSLKLYLIKGYLLEAAKVKAVELSKNDFESSDRLSLAYDNISSNTPFAVRVSGALLALMFFERLEKDDLDFFKGPQTFIQDLKKQSQILTQKQVNPNQIFMLMFGEVMSQSIKSNSGVGYEKRIESTLIKIGIKDFQGQHWDENDKATEFDFFFKLDGYSYGIGAKRTLRERYKQFVKTQLTSHLDVMIQITLGTDLNEEKARIIAQHGVYSFVADEIYNTRTYMQKDPFVYPASQLTLATLRSLAPKK